MKNEKKGKFPKNEEEMQELMSMEASLFYISFLGDAPVIKGEITFSKSQVERHYLMLLNHTIEMLNEAKSLREKIEASEAFLNLKIMPLRIH